MTRINDLEAQLRIPSFRVGDWVKWTYSGDVGLVEIADSDTGPYKIRLVKQWD